MSAHVNFVSQCFRCQQDGKLYRRDLGKIWNKYPKDLHLWLLRLTEEFDLTFPSKEEPANIVPCLLPATEPEVGLLTIRCIFFCTVGGVQACFTVFLCYLID